MPETKIIDIPAIQLQHPDIKAMAKLYKIYETTLHNIRKTNAIAFDFSDCRFFSNHAFVFLGGLDMFLREKYNLTRITYINLPEKIEEYLQRVGFFEKERSWARLPYSDFSMDDIRQKKPYQDINSLLNSPDFPIQSDEAKQIIKEKIGELFLNVYQHSKSPAGATASAQYYPTDKTIRFALVDFGIGISKNIQKFLKRKFKQNISGGDALLKAFEERFTTKENSSGLGLKIIKDFVLQNESRISIFCNKVCYQYIGKTNSEERYLLKVSRGFNGTYIIIDFDTTNICHSIQELC